MRYFLGVDVGNSKSHALIADENGRSLGFGTAGPGSWEAVGWDGAAAVLHDIVAQAVAMAGITREQIAGAGFGFAGYDWPEDKPGHTQLVASLGLMQARVAFSNDAIVGLVAGAEAGWGVVVVAGTGNNCRGRDRQGREGRMTGDGWRFAEYGGAGEIVLKAVQAVSLAWTRRGEETGLTAVFLQETGASDVEDMIAGLIRGRYHLSARHAPLVFAQAKAGDAVAQEILVWAGTELGSLAVGVIRQLALENEAFDVVLSGSLYKGSGRLREIMAATIHEVAPQARLVRLKAPPVVGGVLWGMEVAGWETAVCRPVLLETADLLVNGR
ncbi:MAG: BadF/BadG/BcrA/BcrD ATPase family protein [Chloroflexota bacterium]